MAALSKALGQVKADQARTHIEHLADLDIYCQPLQLRKTSIICTIGPVSQSVDQLLSLMKAGMSVVRMNFSHGSHEYHAATVQNARAAAAIFGRPIAIALDTKGPEIRTGSLEGQDTNPLVTLELVAGEKVVLSTDIKHKLVCNKEHLYVDYTRITAVVQPGAFVYIDDGLISLKVIQVLETSVITEVVNSGTIGSHKGVNLPETNVDLPALSDRDILDLKFGVAQGVDMIFASFIRRREDVQHIREVLGAEGAHIKIISKIENHQGMQHFDGILEETDGVMVARGDLGIEIPTEKVFLAQKMMIAKCNIAGKPIITATQMLESMIKSPRPTRAEASDVANAVIDGSDCVMLSGETAKGQYPFVTVDLMARVCLEAESAVFYSAFRTELRTLGGTRGATDSIALAAIEASVSVGAKAIITLTVSGNTARQLSKWRPLAPIFAVTREGWVARQLNLSRGVYPIHSAGPRETENWAADVDARIQLAFNEGKSLGVIAAGDLAVVVHGWTSGAGHTNTLRILKVT